jgi:hypothetical protein
MKTLLEIPFEHYSALLARCSTSEIEYTILKNGIVLPDSKPGKQQTTVAIRCEPDQAKTILDLARRLYPEAVPYIQEFTSSE